MEAEVKRDAEARVGIGVEATRKTTTRMGKETTGAKAETTADAKAQEIENLKNKVGVDVRIQVQVGVQINTVMVTRTNQRISRVGRMMGQKVVHQNHKIMIRRNLLVKLIC